MNALNDFNDGVSYEHFICDKLWFTRFEGDQDRGDTTCGTEIKFDRRLNQTGNLFFETEQLPIRTNGERNGSWVRCGCFKKCRRYLIGDCSRALLFDGASLRKWFSEKSEDLKRSFKTGDSFRGYALSYKYMESQALRQYVWQYSWDWCLKVKP